MSGKETEAAEMARFLIDAVQRREAWRIPIFTAPPETELDDQEDQQP